MTDAVDDITTVDDFLAVSENHILEDVNDCVAALQVRSTFSFSIYIFHSLSLSLFLSLFQPLSFFVSFSPSPCLPFSLSLFAISPFLSLAPSPLSHPFSFSYSFQSLPLVLSIFLTSFFLFQRVSVSLLSLSDSLPLFLSLYLLVSL